MRKNKMMRTAAGLLVATLLTTSVISGTFAKYTSEATGTDSARVAKWSFKVGETDIASSTNNTFTFDLFKTVNGYDDITDDAEVKNGTDENIIAPGTSGFFDIVLKNESEVTAKYGIDFTETNASNIPIEYSTDNGTTWKSNIDELDITEGDTNTLGFEEANKTKTIKVQWRWAYEAGQSPVREQTDEKDTGLGTGATATVSVTAKITATQVD